MKYIFRGMILACLLVEIAGSMEIPNTSEDVVDTKRPIYQPMHFNLFTRLQGGRMAGVRGEVARQVFSIGKPRSGGSGEHGSIGYRYIIRYAGSLHADGVLIEPADVYAVSIVERHRNTMITNHMAVIYQGKRKTLYSSSRFLCVLTPEEWESGEDHPTLQEWGRSDLEIEAENQDDMHDMIGGLITGEAKIVGDRLTMNMPDILLEFMLDVIEQTIGVQIKNRAGESILGLRLNARMEDMYWEDALTSVLKEHGLMLVKDKNTGEYSIRRED